MKRILCLLLAISLCLTLCSCGKSEAAAIVDSLITEIETVTLDSEEAIKKAEDAYAKLSEKDKNAVENYASLVEARLTYDTLLEETLVKADEVEVQLTKIAQKIETLDIRGAISDLSDVEPILSSQEETITELYQRIDDLCFPGTHILKAEYILDLELQEEQSGVTHYADSAGTDVWFTSDQLDIDRAYYCYGFSGDSSYELASDYKNSLLNRYMLIRDVSESEYWHEWAVKDGKSTYPEAGQVRVDDLGNVMTWFSHGTMGSSWYIEITIIRDL